MDDEDLYDEFGNYIGDSLDSSDNDDDDLSSFHPPSINDNEYSEEEEHEEEEDEEDNNNTALIKSNIATNQGETIYIQSQTQSLSNQPIIQPIYEKKMKLEYTTQSSTNSNGDEFPELTYSRDYLISLLNQCPERIRNISIIGDFQCGKTTLLDQLIMFTHPTISNNTSNTRYLDNHKLEIERELTIKSSPITLLLSDSKSRSQIFNLIDTPGHIDFEDEILSALNITDGVILIIDAILGLTPQNQDLIDEILQQELSMIIIINKFDKLILELKLPIKDCYYKLVGIIDDINDYIKSNKNKNKNNKTKEYKFSPDLNNVLFASSKFGIIFNLKSFAKLYINKQNSLMNINEFSRRLWGENYYDPENHKFIHHNNNNNNNNNNNGSLNHSFISFILEPIYKIITYTITNEPNDKRLSKLLWENFQISLSNKFDYKKNVEDLLKSVFQTIFNNYESFVDSVIEWIPSAVEVATKQQQPEQPEQPEQQPEIDNSSIDKLARVTKLIESSDGKSFSSLVRIYKGNLTIGDKIKIYGENYYQDKDDYKLEIIKKIYLPGGRYNFPINQANFGNIVLIDGIDSIIKKGTAIITTNKTINDTTIIKNFSLFNSSKYINKSIFKVAIEPEIPSELPILLEGLKKINKSYLSSIINVEENGEHIILTKGELSMDCILHDLRFFYCDDLQIKVSDPMIKFSETCIENGYTKTKATTKTVSENDLLSITIIVEPINDIKLSHDIEIGKLNLDMDFKQLNKFLKLEYGWDSLKSKSLWSIGSINDLKNPTILLNDILEKNNINIESIKSSIISGFKWSINEGPLVGDPIRNVQFKIIDISTTTTTNNNNNNNSSISSAQIIPLMRRACHDAISNALPKLMEPIYQLNVICSYKAINVIKHLLNNNNNTNNNNNNKRRGIIDKVIPIPGTLLFFVQGYIPVIDSIGILIDIKLNTQGQAIGSLKFNHHWEIVPDELSEEFIIKTRKRKGI
ncbi:U5 small nuclear ribonucleoprotein component, putative [Candida dubliniensis CD36]|uniref:U5 small nuclear ribonucleoprotein component, putative n=1 Tax=Candida dubliniensis (strain CD36 / ATCC MYA-646 / CBS 7987 / NCPF 3949 / NRRL Y-17841) TaxID=573826 RepID=B9WBD2_CANDC|nr:U5 small nuclear ribonucleoprotein component, putative [Candida dubliniensis CD36]CAX43702.1 U5 small nuclear ribonucleoprotein component, putative [Candida dubliniensis CD36]